MSITAERKTELINTHARSPGDTGSASSVVAVPGTGSLWAAGTLTAIRSGTTDSDILRYTP